MARLPPLPPPSRIVYDPVPDATTTTNHFRGIVWMLHGWAQNTTGFAQRSQKLTKRLTKNGFQVVILQAPHRLPPKPVQTESDICHKGHVDRDPCTLHETDKGPHHHQPMAPTSRSREYAYAWFFYDNENGDDPHLEPSPTGSYKGMDESLQFLQQELYRARENPNQRTKDPPSSNPPIFMLDFSQGAVVVHKIATLVCSTRDDTALESSSFLSSSEVSSSESRSSITTPSNAWSAVGKCILVSGFPYKAVSNNDSNDDRIDNGISSTVHNGNHGSRETQSTQRRQDLTIPSLHVIGSRDVRVAPALSRQLATQCGFVEPQLWEHDRGHVLPQDTAFCQAIIDFLTCK